MDLSQFDSFGGRPLYYDVFGNPISMLQWAHLIDRRNNKLYGIVSQEDFEVDGHSYWISTVWLGLDHNLFEGIPMIFETMIFDNEDWHETILGTFRETVACFRWSTLDHAYRGHTLAKEGFIADRVRSGGA